MNKDTIITQRPSILAPAGNRASFLAALAAGADAVYCGMKHFSARMEAKNFTLDELMGLTELAHERNVKVYVAINSLLKPEDLDQAGKLLYQLNQKVKPDGLIIQDLALVQLARQTGFSGELHLSTLANVSFSMALKLIRANLNIDRVVLPRELTVDEIKLLAKACPRGLGLEVFVHGALCYGVSGRCYWSSFFGGKSGLRGRCVQPCRRVYSQTGQAKRFFSCQDLSFDVLVKILLTIPQVVTWKIEGRKKSPHYVFYTVKAYKMLRDFSNDPHLRTEAKKEVQRLLSYALGRTVTHYNILSQRPHNPINIESQTGSGFFMGKIQGSMQRPYLIPREELLPDDVLRLGYEDESWHQTVRVKKHVPKRGRFYIKYASKKNPAKGVPVFLTDRREKELAEMISELEEELKKVAGCGLRVAGCETHKSQIDFPVFNAMLPKKSKKRALVFDLHVYRNPGKETTSDQFALWLSSEAEKRISSGIRQKLWWWLPPVIWPGSEKKIKDLVDRALKNGSRNFVLNAPWQAALFKIPKGVNLWAGPFCNISNALAINNLESIGFSGVIISPELSQKDYFLLPKQSPLPLGIIISGNWPLCISRTISDNLKTDMPFTSPKGEQAWVSKYGPDFWVFPNWKLDIIDKKNALQVAGYSVFVYLHETVPRSVKLKKRPGPWNWNIDLM